MIDPCDSDSGIKGDEESSGKSGDGGVNVKEGRGGRFAVITPFLPHPWSSSSETEDGSESAHRPGWRFRALIVSGEDGPLLLNG